MAEKGLEEETNKKEKQRRERERAGENRSRERVETAEDFKGFSDLAEHF